MMDIKVIPKKERKIYSAEIQVNLTSLQNHYKGQKLNFWKEFKIHNVAINFSVLDTNFNTSLKDKGENKSLYFIVENAPWSWKTGVTEPGKVTISNLSTYPTKRDQMFNCILIGLNFSEKSQNLLEKK